MTIRCKEDVAVIEIELGDGRDAIRIRVAAVVVNHRRIFPGDGREILRPSNSRYIKVTVQLHAVGPRKLDGHLRRQVFFFRSARALAGTCSRRDWTGGFYSHTRLIRIARRLWRRWWPPRRPVLRTILSACVHEGGQRQSHDDGRDHENQDL